MTEESMGSIASSKSDAILTDRGLSLIAHTMSGDIIRFPRVMAGDGVLPDGQDPAQMGDLVHPVYEMEIRAIENPPGVGRATVKTQLSSKMIREFLLLREIGLFAEDPDSGEVFLYAYLNFGPDKGIPIPVEPGPFPLWFQFDFNIIVGRAEVLAIEAENPLGVTFQELRQMRDALLWDAKRREMSLQTQTDHLAEASIKKSLNYIERRLEVA